MGRRVKKAVKAAKKTASWLDRKLRWGSLRLRPKLSIIDRKKEPGYHHRTDGRE